MPGVYDEMSPRAFPDYPGGTRPAAPAPRRSCGTPWRTRSFTVYEWEWWHFDYNDWPSYPILNLTFDKLAALNK